MAGASRRGWAHGAYQLHYSIRIFIQYASFVALLSAYGVHAQMNWAGGVVLGLLLRVLQVAFSTIWLRHFSMGPIEYVWRLATYGYRERHE
jgi:uncharacterized membrane protein YeiB